MSVTRFAPTAGAGRFFFRSESLPKSKAKQLQKHFPFFKLGTAQEVTARALGYASWYECLKLGCTGLPSLSDQDAGLSTRVLRYDQQARALMQAGMPPFDADSWVRAWGLTGSPTLAPHLAKPLFYQFSEAIRRLESGEVSEEELDAELGNFGWSKYPEYDIPTRVCDGVILGSAGSKYPHYAIDPSLIGRIPIYLRGGHSCFHIDDDAVVLSETFPSFPYRDHEDLLIDRLSPVQREWHDPSYVNLNSGKSSLDFMRLNALKNPQKMIALSIRLTPLPGGSFDLDRFVIPCLSGADFANFLNMKGEIDTSRVVWFHDVQSSDLPLFDPSFGSWTHDITSPVFEAAHRYVAGLPFYSYPFKRGPMSMYEYEMHFESVGVLSLSADYSSEEEQLVE